MRLFLLVSSAFILSFGISGCPKSEKIEVRTEPKTDDSIKKKSAALVFSPEIIAELPHDSLSYTQGLFIENGALYESAGLYGQSSLSEISMKTWKPERRIPIEGRYFAEGSTILNGKLYLLTYQEKTCFVYDPLTFIPQASFGYEGEGWGITNDGKKLYMSNGSDKITIREPSTFSVESTISVSDAGTPVERINELEWIEGELWANIYQDDKIARIDPKTGYVKSWLDCKELRSRTKGKTNAEVLNGIAYNPKTKTVFITGKNWGTLFEIKAM